MSPRFGCHVPSLLIGILVGIGLRPPCARGNESGARLEALSISTFDAGVAGGALFRIGVGASAFLVPLMLQLGFGLSPLTSGLVTLWGAVGALAMKFFARGALAKLGFRQVLVWNALASSLAIGLMALTGPSTPLVLISGLMLMTGVLRSLQFTSLNAISYADIEPDRAPAATTLASVGQQVSISFGVALGALALEASALLSGRATPVAADYSAALIFVALLSALSVWRLSRSPPAPAIFCRDARLHPSASSPMTNAEPVAVAFARRREQWNTAIKGIIMTIET